MELIFMDEIIIRALTAEDALTAMPNSFRMTVLQALVTNSIPLTAIFPLTFPEAETSKLNTPPLLPSSMSNCGE